MDWSLIFTQALGAAVGLNAILFALAAMGLNIHFGYTGLLNFGQVGFIAVGAYGLAISVSTFGLSAWVGLLIGMSLGVLLALILGIPTLRLRADYLAIVTIAASEIIRFTLGSVAFRDVSGGSSGLQQFAGEIRAVNPFPPGNYAIGPLNYTANQLFITLAGWLIVALFAFSIYSTMRSPWGRVLKSIREAEDAATSLGKSVYAFKLQSLVYGGLAAGLGGIIVAVGVDSVSPQNYMTPITFFAYLALILGGTARVFGPILGSMIFWMLLSLTDTILRQAIGQGYIPTWLMTSTQVGQVRFMMVGLGLMLLMVFRPQGILGDRREMELDA
jgi:neutral amino acid transport system permease protein